MQNTVPTHHYDKSFLGIFDALKISKNNPVNEKEKLEARKNDIKKKFQNAEGQVKFNYLMELSSIEAQLKNLPN